MLAFGLLGSSETIVVGVRKRSTNPLSQRIQSASSAAERAEQVDALDR